MLNFGRPSKLRTLLVLGRVSNLPTVWSNCLAGWWLAGGGNWRDLTWVAIGASLIYIGGMFLNDAFDANFDSTYRKSRPIPSGAISEGEVWRWGFGWLTLGVASVAWMGMTTAILAAVLALCVVVYNIIHKMVAVAPVVMGACRVIVYLTAASVGVNGVAGEVIWKGLALGGYIVGLSLLARKESARVEAPYWPCALLAAPVAAAWLLDDGEDLRAAILCSVILFFWVTWTILQNLSREHPNIGRAVSRLLAGVCVVDLLAVADFSGPCAGIFGICFLLALLLQRSIPAT